MALESPELSKSNGAGKKIRIHGRVVTESEIHEYILNLINNEKIGKINELSKKIGKGVKQTKRYLIQMQFLNLIELDPVTNRLIKSKIQENIEINERLFELDEFRKIPEITKFIEKSIKRGCKPKTILGYTSSLKIIFQMMKTHPSSALTSKSAYEEFFENYVIVAKERYTHLKDAPHNHRVAYRVFGDTVAGYSYGHGMAKGFGFGSHHASFQKYAGSHILLDVCQDLQKMMLADKEFLVYTWFSTGIMTGGRTSAVATMIWEKIIMDIENFSLDQFETKDDSAGHQHLGEFGEWKHKFPPKELYNILLKWRNENPKFSKFLWFEDSGNDKQNIRNSQRCREYVIPKLKEYLHRVEDRLDSLTKEYVFVAGESGHLNRHTFAQLLKNAGATDDQIAFQGGWKSKQTIGWYCSISQDEKQKSRKLIADVFSNGAIEN